MKITLSLTVAFILCIKLSGVYLVPRDILIASYRLPFKDCWYYVNTLAIAL